MLWAIGFGGVVALVDPALHDDHGVVGQLVALFLHGAGEHHHFDRRAQVLEGEHGHEVALAGPLALQAGDDAADRLHGPVVERVELVDGAVGPAGQRRLGAEQRVIADVQPEHLLLEGQAVALVELEVGDGGPLEVVAGPTVVATTEQGHDPHVPLAPAGDRVVDDLLEHREQALAWMADVVEGAGLDQRLDRALVEDLGVDPLAEVVEVGVRPAGLALGHDVGDEALADVPHRRQPEDDAERRLTTSSVSITGVKSLSDRLM